MSIHFDNRLDELTGRGLQSLLYEGGLRGLLNSFNTRSFWRTLQISFRNDWWYSEFNKNMQIILIARDHLHINSHKAFSIHVSDFTFELIEFFIIRHVYVT